MNFLWDKLEVLLCCENQLADLQEKLFTFQFYERSWSIKLYAEDMRSGVHVLQISITNNFLVNRLKVCLSPKLRQQVNVVTGSFDTVASLVSELILDQRKTSI